MSDVNRRESQLKRAGLALVALFFAGCAAAGALLEAIQQKDLSGENLTIWILVGLGFLAVLGVIGVYLRTIAVKRMRRRAGI